jgi:hypothetical protein
MNGIFKGTVTYSKFCEILTLERILYAVYEMSPFRSLYLTTPEGTAVILYNVKTHRRVNAWRHSVLSKAPQRENLR